LIRAAISITFETSGPETLRTRKRCAAPQWVKPGLARRTSSARQPAHARVA
jgi:hypothetical protein